MDIAELGIRVDSTGAAKATSDLDRLGDQAATTSAQVVQMSQRTGRSFRSMSGSLAAFNRMAASPTFRGLSLQLSQVAQAATATGQPLRALAIQAADIGLYFGPLGIAAGAAAGALIPLAAGFLSAGSNAEEAEDKLDAFAASVKLIQDQAKLATTPISELTEEFGRFAEGVQRGARIAAQAALSQSLVDLAEAQGAIAQELSEVEAASDRYLSALNNMETLQRALGEETLSNSAAYDQMRRSIAEAAQEAADAAAEIGLTKDQASALQSVLGDLANANGMEAVAEAATKALFELDRMFDASQSIPPEIAEITGQLRVVQIAAAAGVTAFEEVETAADDIAAAVRGITFDGAISGAAALAQQLNISLAAAQALSDVRSPTTEGDRSRGIAGFESDDPRGGGGAIFTGETRRASTYSPPAANAARRGGGGRGGGSVSPAFDPLESIREQIVEQERLRNEMRLSEAQVVAYRAEQEALDAAKREGIELSDAMRTAIGSEASQLEAVTQAVIDAREQQELMAEAQQELVSGFADMVMGSFDAEAALRSLSRQLIEFGANMALAGLFPNTFSAPTLPSFGGGRADGGGVMAGTAYLVNENTPNSEIYVPSRSGAVLNVGQAQAALANAYGGGGGKAPVVNVPIEVKTAPGFEPEVTRRSDGRVDIDLAKAVEQVLMSGRLDRGMRVRYGAQPVGRGS